MKIGNKEIKLFYNNQAAIEVNELCGGIKNIRALVIDEEGNSRDEVEQLRNIYVLIRILANNEIRRHNMLVSMGVISEEKQEEFTDEQLSVLLDASKITEYFIECMNVMGLASKFIVPDSVKLADPDIDLEEIEAEQNP